MDGIMTTRWKAFKRRQAIKERQRAAYLRRNPTAGTGRKPAHNGLAMRAKISNRFSGPK